MSTQHTVYHSDGSSSSSYNQPQGHSYRAPQGYSMQPQQQQQHLSFLNQEQKQQRDALSRAQMRLSELEEVVKEDKEDNEKRVKSLEAQVQAHKRWIDDARKSQYIQESMHDQLIDEIKVLRKEVAELKSFCNQLQSENVILREDLKEIQNPTVRRSSRLSKKRAQESPGKQDQKRSKTT